MKIGMLGAGKVGRILATKYAALGHEVLVANSRGPDSVAAMFADVNPPVVPASIDDALACEIVVLATPWTKVSDVLPRDLAWHGRILVDTTNIYVSYKDELIVDDLHGDYGSEIVARRAPGARAWSKPSIRFRSM